MSLTVKQFQEKVTGESKRMCGCGCGEKLEPRVDGEHHTIGGKEVNSDCYFESLGTELEKYPILPPRIRRRA